MKKEFNFMNEIEEELDRQFPKGKCKERGNALVLYAIINLKFKEFIRLLKEGIGLIYGINKESAIKSGVSLKLRNEILDLLSGSLDEVRNILDKLAGEDLKNEK